MHEDKDNLVLLMGQFKCVLWGWELERDYFNNPRVRKSRKYSTKKKLKKKKRIKDRGVTDCLR